MTHKAAPPSGTPGSGDGLPTNGKAGYSVLFGVGALTCSFLSPFDTFRLG